MAIGTLNVGVSANASKGIASLKGFRKEVKGTKDDCNLASKSVASMGSIVTKFGLSLGGSLAAYASARTFLTIAQDLGTLSRTATKLNVAPVALMGLRHAAEQTGVATETLDNALMKMTVRAAEAAKGGGDAASVLKELKIDAMKFAQLSPDRQFVSIAGAMAKQTNQADKLRIATKLFEEEGTALVATLKLGESGLAAMTKEAKSLSGELSREDLLKVDQLNKALDRLRKSAGGAGNAIVIEAAPSLIQATDGMTEALQGMKSFRMPENVITRNVGAAGKAGWNAMAGVYYRNFFGGADDNAAGALTDAERLAHNKRVSADKFRHSTDPNVAHQRMVHAAARGNRIREGQAFNDATVGVASRAIGSGFAGFTSLMGQMRQQGERLEKFMKSRPSHLNPLSGLAPLGMSAARKAYMAGEGSKPGQSMGLAVPQSINALIEADSSEGYMALRANKRGGSEVANRTAKAAEATAAGVDRVVAAVADLTKQFNAVPFLHFG